MASVQLRHVGKRYGDGPEVMSDIQLHIDDGEFVVFVGPSGCGKSTLLRMIAGLEEISDGELEIGGERMNEVPAAKRGIAMVFQSYALYPHMSLYDNMAFGLKLAGKSRAEIDAAVRRAAAILHIDHLLERKPKALSGGQRQRVAIGRAITRQPKVFLFDEPLSNLDAALRVKMRLEFARLHQQLKTTMIYVTHDQVEAMTLADKIVVLSAGRVEQVGAPRALYHHPANRFVAGFIGSPRMNFLPGRVLSIQPAGVAVRLDGGGELLAAVTAQDLKPGDAVAVGVRPEHLQPAPGPAALRARVAAVESLGDCAYLYAEAPDADEPLISRISDAQDFAAGDETGFSAQPHHCHLFREDGLALPRLPR
ncbi:ABC transporter ATP-binding protein [Chromobacterium rhizoryzae]|uniref:ABC transporter ATP-binding protein n=1 Tax=Chromobacterium rhizoryzae TaxID=1778675 RepID=UPI001D06B625|nr:sn-glycerol-3-phosphate ABC transporter ATP-binding protein UgpC [Chromobacterium rhizoryzae]